jgi:diguanylate cyclase (GGDEF)-like protein
MKVLIADDSPIVLQMLTALLAKAGHEVVVTRTGSEAWSHFESDAPPDLALIDWVMPDMEGPELCRKVRSLAREPYPYLILVTGKSQSEDVVLGLDAGADDYVVKPFRVQEVRARVSAATRIVDLQRQLIEAREQIRLQSTTDVLTRALNRATVVDRLCAHIADMRGDETLAVILADVDDFRDLNATRGHDVGDAALRELAARLRACLPGPADIGRYGADEFLMVVSGQHTEEDYVTLAEQCLIEATLEPIEAGGHSVELTCSAGVVTAGGSSYNDAGWLLCAVDAALFAARAAGGGAVESFSLSDSTGRLSMSPLSRRSRPGARPSSGAAGGRGLHARSGA